MPEPERAKGTILVIEDDAYIARVYERALHARGFAMQLIVDGDKAFDALAQMNAPPSAIILDIMLPHQNGGDILRHIRSDHRYDPIPIMMVTNAFEEEDRETYTKMGADAFLIKVEHEPLSIVDELEKLIRSKAAHS